VRSTIDFVPKDCNGGSNCVYGRKHVPWISFANVPSSSNVRFKDDFPNDYSQLPTVAFVVPNLNHDMHNGGAAESIPAGDHWLQQNLDDYYQWAKKNNSLLIVTFDENDDKSGYRGPTDPQTDLGPTYPPVDADNQHLLDLQNRIVTIFAGAHIKQGYKPDAYSEGKGITHVNILRTIEAMYGLPKSGAQQSNAVRAGIGDETIVTDIFEPIK
jgi:phosphatidylinositol-3-phosphatase